MTKNLDYSKAKEIQVTENGQEIKGRYIIRGKMITVLYGMGEVTTQLGGSSPESLARIILRELITGSRK
jgi:hypothetical protein